MACLDEIQFKTLVVNEQLMIAPDKDGWSHVLNDKCLEGLQLVIPEVIRDWETIVRKHAELMLALGIFHKEWYHYQLLRVSNKYHRIHLGETKCHYCSWRGLTANPWLYDIYFGAADIDASLDEARNRFSSSILACPNCQSKLRDAPIWISSLLQA